MVSNAPTGVRATLTSTSATSWTDASAATVHQQDADAITSVLTSGARATGPPPWRFPLELASAWEAGLVAVLFLLISGLVALRAAELVSERDVSDLLRSLRTEERGDSGERKSDRSRHTSDSRDDHHAGDDHHDGDRDDHDGHDVDHTQTHTHYRYLSPETPPDLLSDEGEVVKLLIENDGRIRQHRIADETGWSRSKVSRICSQMHADGRIEKRSVGRENVISLSEVDPADGDERDHDSDSESDDVENPLT